MRMRSVLLLTCALALGAGTTGAQAGGAMPPSGDPDTPIYCDYGHLGGSSSWLPNGIGVTASNNHYTIDIEADCPLWGPIYNTLRDTVVQPTGGRPLPAISDDAGHYSLHLEGDSVDTCVHGASSNGALSGYGPEGPIDGTFWFHREGPHLWVSGTMNSAGEAHRFTLWLDIVPNVGIKVPPTHVDGSVSFVQQVVAWLTTASPNFNGACVLSPIQDASIVGHGTIRDPGDRSGPVWEVADQAVLTIGGLQPGLR
jgi:hypothetical protein